MEAMSSTMCLVMSLSLPREIDLKEFSPSQAQAIHRAFERLCVTLELNDATPGLRIIVAKAVVMLARSDADEHEPLYERALAYLCGPQIPFD
jgi:hypothetical protein